MTLRGIYERFRRLARKIYLIHKRSKLKNKNISIISNNCLGGCIAHDLKIKFESPTINLYFSYEDFLKFCSNLKYYLSLEPVEYFNHDKKCPVGIIDDVIIYFLHYENFNEAKLKWLERSKRVNYENIYIIFSNANKTCKRDDDLYKKFDSLPFKNKAFLVNKNYGDVSNLKNVFIIDISKVENIDNAPSLAYKSKFSFKKVYDDFDYVKFFNTK